MVDISKKAYIKKSDLKAGDKIVFLNEGSWQKKDFSKAKDGSNTKDCFVMLAVINNDKTPKDLNLNNTSKVSLGNKWGYETKDWVGRVASVSFVKAMSFGQMMEVLCLEATDDKVDVEKLVWNNS